MPNVLKKGWQYDHVLSRAAMQLLLPGVHEMWPLADFSGFLVLSRTDLNGVTKDCRTLTLIGAILEAVVEHLRCNTYGKLLILHFKKQ